MALFYNVPIEKVDEWIKQVSKGVKTSGVARQMHPNSLRNLSPRPELLKDRRTCNQIKRDGNKCMAPALTGSPRCRHHNGHYFAPEHPSSRKLVENGTAQRALAHRALRAEVKRFKYEDRRTVRDTIRAAHSRAARGSTLEHIKAVIPPELELEGLNALIAAERGDSRPWHSWKKRIPKPRYPPHVYRQYNDENNKRDSSHE